jgi:hypothetical protein
VEVCQRLLLPLPRRGLARGVFHLEDATEKAGIEAALNRCRALAAQIASELRNRRPELFVDKLNVVEELLTPWSARLPPQSAHALHLHF